jgi:large subunit ribosomal protein L30e
MVGLSMGKKKLSRARESIISSLSLVTKSGKYSLGIGQTLKSLRTGEAKLVILATNVAPTHKSVIEYYAMLSRCEILPFEGDNVDLGTACGKYFRSSVIAIIDPGESEILTMLKEKKD